MDSKNYHNIILLYKIILIYGLCLVFSKAELPRFAHATKSDGSLILLVVGDWGRRGTFNQTEVAIQMANVGRLVDPDFIISTGDNFYEDGLTCVDDPAFEESFSNIYMGPEQWYSVLGNHDYRGDVLAQLDPILNQKDARWICLRSFIISTDVADLFLVDTTPFVDKYFTDPEDHTYDWRGVLPREEYLSNLLKENHVDIYVNGHDHSLEHISSSDSPLQFLTSGGGSKAWRQTIRPWNPQELKFYYDGQGFMTMALTENGVLFQFHDVLGNILHQWSGSKGFET
ncbi:hypothetical protein ACH5RR_029735 [Cinchona calisaya]|uniref:acid phosphatase n=1 Tax=Cinchona calisaya TaxID=153742 RepID=A0ABD2YU15_9GENT